MKKFYFLLFYLISSYCSPVYAQNTAVLDSLNHVYKTATHDTTKILALADIAYLYYLQFDTCLVIAQKGIELSEKIRYEVGKGRCYSAMSASYYRAKDNYVVALSYGQKALEIAEKTQDSKGQRLALNMIGMTHYSLGNYEQALPYFQKCVEISEKINDLYGISENTLNIGLVLEKQKKYQEALEIQRKTLLTAQKDRNEYESYALTNIGAIYIEQNKYDSAIWYLTKGMEIGKKFNDSYIYTYTLAKLAKAYQKQNKQEQGLQYAQEALVMANQNNLLTEKKEASEVLYEIYKNQAQYKKAMEYLELGKQANDSLTNIEKAKSVANLENKLVLERKNQELNLLTKDNEQQKMKQNIYIGFIAVFSFFVILLGVAFNQKRKSNRLLLEQKLEIKQTNEELATTNEELHQTQEEITTQRDLLEIKNNLLVTYTNKIGQSIKAAKMIQKSILPPKLKMQELFREHFVLFRPKDVVSGDFWWANEIEGKKYLIVADCTGHGVAGAMLTMIGSSLLDRIIRLSGIQEPAEILTKLHEEVKDILQQEQTQSSEGMDIAIVHWHYENENCILSFAAAKRPLIYAHDGNVEKISGSRRNIGGVIDGNKSFETTTISLPKNTNLYLFSDGYSDQNDVERNNFSEKRLINLLQENQHLPMEEQKEILNQQLIKQMEGTEQRDDILVIGVRL